MLKYAKRFTISLTPELVKQLDIVKKNEFYNKSQTEMINFLLRLGLKQYFLKNKRRGKYERISNHEK